MVSFTKRSDVERLVRVWRSVAHARGRLDVDDEGMRPAVGSDLLYSRHFPDSVQGQLIYVCVINMPGMPMFTVGDEERTVLRAILPGSLTAKLRI